MGTEHLRGALDPEVALADLTEIASHLERTDSPSEVKKGNAGATKAHGPSTRVRGIHVGDQIRMLVSKTLAKQFHEYFETAIAPFQVGVVSRSGTDCAIHALNVATNFDKNATNRGFVELPSSSSASPVLCATRTL